jgi:Zn-dependent peptidase ImmA (M78 family)
MSYEDLLKEYADEGLIIKEKPLTSSAGRIYNNKIAIRHNMSNVDKTCTLAEELGHYYTTTGDILDQDNISNRKQEHRARMWAYGKLLPLQFFVLAFKHGCRSIHETAEFLEVSEEFLIDCINAYHSKYGPFLEMNGYLFMFSETGLNISKSIK